VHRVRAGAGGYTRRRRGSGFSYVDRHGETVRDRATLARIRSLAIPPAWEDVWICDDPAGHLQATGTDAAGRRQYRYHDAWRARRDLEKHRRMEGFAERLPTLRARVKDDLRLRGATRDRVLACAVRMLDRGALRIGTEEYTRANGSFGLATLRKEHLSIRRDGVLLRFPGKAGKTHAIRIDDPAIVPVLRSLRRHPGGDELLAYRDEHGWTDLRASHINAYIRETVGDGYSAKDFRTWRATVLAAVFLAEHEVSEGRRAVTSVGRRVADELGNTPAVARASYIDPRVVDRFLDEGLTVAAYLPDGPSVVLPLPDRELERVEAAVLALLRDDAALVAAA
jgi:DNA topoisomerase IB